MSDLRWEPWAAIIAFLIAWGYTLSPGPYWMVAFTFVAQPLFLMAMAGFIIKERRDLSGRRSS